MAHSIRVGGLTATQRASLSSAEQTENKDQANGYPGLNGDGNLQLNGFYPRYGTIADYNTSSVVLGDGELALAEKDVLLGDGVKVAGFPTSLYSGATDFVKCQSGRTNAQSGAAMVAAYERAAALTPGGNALSATNRVALMMLGGVYDISATGLTTVDYVDIVGVGGQPLIIADTNGLVHSTNNRFTNLSFTPASSGSVMIPVTAATSGWYHNCRFGGTSTASTLSAGNISVDNLWIRDCVFDCMAFNFGFGGTFGSGVLIERCRFNTWAFRSANVNTFKVNFNGILRNSQLLHTATYMNLGATGVVEDCLLNCAIQNVTTGAQVHRNRFTHTSGASLRGGTSPTISATYNYTLTTLLGSGVTNSLAEGYNIEGGA